MKRRLSLQTLVACALAAIAAGYLIWIGVPLFLLLLQVLSVALSR